MPLEFGPHETGSDIECFVDPPRSSDEESWTWKDRPGCRYWSRTFKSTSCNVPFTCEYCKYGEQDTHTQITH